jgi:hypothetical protein
MVAISTKLGTAKAIAAGLALAVMAEFAELEKAYTVAGWPLQALTTAGTAAVRTVEEVAVIMMQVKQ